jgi:hypothetical protein
VGHVSRRGWGAKVSNQLDERIVRPKAGCGEPDKRCTRRMSGLRLLRGAGRRAHPLRVTWAPMIRGDRVHAALSSATAALSDEG